MGHLRIDVPPELEQRLEEEAKKRGQEVGEYARAVLEASLAPAADGTGDAFWDQLPRRAPEELDALARAQGAPLAARFEDLIGDFWPEDETCDEFIATIRQWRREKPRRGRPSS